MVLILLGLGHRVREEKAADLQIELLRIRKEINAAQRLLLLGGLDDELAVAETRPMAERWKLMSVTLASGIIATLRTTSPLTRIIRLFVTAKYATRQAATRYRRYTGRAGALPRRPPGARSGR